MARAKVFVSYSHKDESWKHRLSTHLGVLEQQGLLELWCDRDIGVGRDWEEEIDRNLLAAKIAVLVISANFLASSFVVHEEVPRLLDRHAAAGMRVVPVLIKDCAWQTVPWLKRLQMLPRDARAIAALPRSKVENALAGVALEVFGVLESPDVRGAHPNMVDSVS